jgi:CubicO group peptidase (beta-lactamase class C family)/beta-lactamase regulating signal transducer with metallopeptidase domain
MSAPLNLLTLGALSLWFGLIVCATTMTVCRLAPGLGPRARYRIWYLAFVGILVLPLVPLLWPTPGPEPAAVPSLSDETTTAARESVQPDRRSAFAAPDARVSPEGAPGSGNPQLWGWTVMAPAGLPTLLLWTWLAGVGIGIAGLLFDAIRLHRLRHRAHPPSRALLSIWQTAVAAVPTGRRLRLLVSEDVNVPLACGWRRPAVVFPAELERTMTAEELRQLLMHELAHLSRRDDWHQVAQHVGRVVCWWHPLVRWVVRRLEIECELACDDVVAGRTSRRHYARTLVRMAGLALGQRLAPGASRGRLSERVERLLDRPAPRIGPWRQAGGTLLLGVGLMGAVRLGPPSVGLAIAPAPEARPAAGPSRAAIGPELDRLFRRFADSGFSGTVLLAFGDTVVLEQGYGLADRERGIPATADTRYSTAGITKLFTATAILALEEEGRLRVGDSLARWIGPLPEAKNGVRLHHLLTHTDGLTRLQAPVYRREPGAFVEAVARTPSAFAPGAGYRYNDFGHSLLGMVVERAASEPYEQFIRRRFLSPAGMRATGFESEGGPMAVEYAGPSHLPVAIGPRAYTWGRRGSLGLVSTVGDLFRWFRAMHDPRVLSPAVRERMLVPREATDWGAEQAYGWDLQPRPDGRRIWRRVAGTPGFEGELLHDPSGGWTAVILVNSRLGWRFRVWDAIERAAAASTED